MSDNPTVVFAAPKTVVLEDRPIPEPGRGQVLVKSSRTLISTGTELTILKGEFAKGSAWDDYGKFPFAPGYNSVGEVVQVGGGVDGSLVGRRVAGCGNHALYAALGVEEIRPIEADITDEQAVFATIAEIVFNGVRRGRPEWGEAAIVYGLGLLGQLATRALLFAGANPVFAVDVSDERIGLLPKCARVVGINPKSDNLKGIVAANTSGRMADLVYEVTGNPNLIPNEFEALKDAGRMVLLSSPSGPSTFDFHDLCNAHSYSIIGAHNSSHPACETPYNQWTKTRNAELYFRMVAGGEMTVDELISHRAPYSEAGDLYAMLLEDRTRAMGVVLEWE